MTHVHEPSRIDPPDGVYWCKHCKRPIATVPWHPQEWVVISPGEVESIKSAHKKAPYPKTVE